VGGKSREGAEKNYNVLCLIEERVALDMAGGGSKGDEEKTGSQFTYGPKGGLKRQK